jgi:glycosyltransferase involved in cell wall biosynthesis
MNPGISVVIATYNRCDLLARCLQSLWRSDKDSSGFEVVVVDDGSSDNTAGMLEEERLCHDNLIILYQRNQGQAAARSLGCRHAKGDVLAFTDDDCVVHSSWISAIEREFSSKPILGSDGPVIGFCEGEIVSPFSHYIHNPARSGYLSCNLAVRKVVFDAENGFEPSFRMHEDTDLCLRILKRGEFSFNPRMIIDHPPRRYALFGDLMKSCAYGRHYVQAEYLLYSRHPKEYGRVRFHKTFYGTFLSLSLKYTWMFSRLPLRRIVSFPVDYAKLIILNLARHASVVFWFACTCLSRPIVSRWQRAPGSRGSSKT